MHILLRNQYRAAITWKQTESLPAPGSPNPHSAKTRFMCYLLLSGHSNYNRRLKIDALAVQAAAKAADAALIPPPFVRLQDFCWACSRPGRVVGGGGGVGRWGCGVGVNTASR